MDRLMDKWALVTGASSGFGIEFAALLALKGANLVLVARRKEPMDLLADSLRREHHINIIVETADLSKPGAMADLKERLDTNRIQVDILVNNAGYGLYG